MNSAVLNSPRKFLIIENHLSEPGDDEVIIKIEGCGICGSNLPVWEGREWFNYPMTPGAPGHEAWGIIHEIGDKVTGFNKGDRVTAISYNAFAEYDIAKAEAVVKLPDSFAGLSFPGEPLGCVMNIFGRSRIEPGDTVAVIGVGFLGALLIQLIKNAGAQVIAVSRREFSLDIAKQFGADYTIPLKDHWNIIEQVKEITNGKMCETVIEAIGQQWPLDLAGDIVAEGGKIIIAGYHQESPRQVNMQMWNWKGIDVINAHERKLSRYVDGIKDAINAVETGLLNPDPLYTSYPFEEINCAFQNMEERPGGFIKALITF